MLGVVAVLAVVAVSACGGDNVADTCEQAALLENARARVERAITTLEQTSQLELEEATLDIVDRLALMRDVAPRDLRSPLGVLLAAYGQLTVSLGNTGWDPTLAANDAAVQSARRAFTDQSVATANTSLAEWVEAQCGRAQSAIDPAFAASGTTLPMPEMSEEPSRDAEEESSVSDSELQAIGDVIGESYGVALVASEAECVARTLGVTFGEANDVTLDDSEFFAEVVNVFASCGVTTPPTTTPPITTPDN
jgi:hypothetical protein